MRYVEVVVEVAAVGGVPGEGPALARLVSLDLLQRRARDISKRGVTHVQVFEKSIRDLRGPRRTTRTALLPTRVEHEMADYQLAASLEKVEQGGLPLGPFEHVSFLDPDHRQPAAV